MKFLEKETNRFVLTMVEKNIWMKDLAINYAFFQEKNNQGYESHKKAALAFVTFLNQRRGHDQIEYTNKLELPVNISATYSINLNLMDAARIPVDTFFSTHSDLEGHYISDYAYAFFKIPFFYRGSKKDFIELNNYLFSEKETLVIYQWNNTWSDYFAYGKHSGKGAYLWTIYDPTRKRFTVCGASILS
ncbi:hypothetical protein C6P52_06530 [Enterococcus mundtii]|uniref:hypothetical protein n=1 Tax=Enterococcus mundtii TaxID=53346 RepID=UPI000D37E693|nr:hypothetical protein [Enterococcus mundtii]PTO38969.1 hypothetical protein C6P52_06530 [Enterococcus mundtii]PTO44868.1 hypothetical protein C6P54_02965 [Enterococcus mundtii]